MGPPAPGAPIGLPEQGNYNPGGMLAAWGLMRGPNGEILPAMMRQGMNPYQLGPSAQQIPGYDVGLLGP
jgi:hypothetical protein